MESTKHEKHVLLHDLREAASGEIIVRSLEFAASFFEDAQFQCIRVTTFLASRPSSEQKVFRNPTLIWNGVTIGVHTPEGEDFCAGTSHSQVVLEFGRELSVDETKAFGELLKQFDLILTEGAKSKKGAHDALAPVSKGERDAVTAEAPDVGFSEERKFRILALVHGEFGKRKVKHIRENGPSYWVVESIELPPDLPTLIDDPQEYLPDSVPHADLLLALQENANAAQLIVDYVMLSGAGALLAPIDNSEWLPEGQKNQIVRQLRSMGVGSAFPRPFCAFEECGNPYLDEFARHFGKPVFKVKWERGNVTEVEVVRGSPCGCSVFVADKLKGVRVDESVEAAGLAHHHYPCLAAMAREPDLDDTLMHKSGYMTKEAVDKEIEPYKRKHASYLDPSGMK